MGSVSIHQPQPAQTDSDMSMFFKNQRIGKYEIIDSLGSGGFGSVYLARDVWIDKKVAIKVPHKQGENVEKLLQEPRLLASMNHPNIVGVITAEKTNDVFYIVMEYVEGCSLEQHLKKHGPLPWRRGLDWFVQLCSAVVYAHDRNIIHRDIRPANVLISNEGGIKLADLGTSRYLLDNFASTRIGSPPYMAPEHFKGKATLQSDLYSIGILMYECLTGKLPYFDRDPLKLAQIAREGQYQPVHHVNQDVPPQLAKITAQAMHRSLATRYKSARRLKEDLEAVVYASHGTPQPVAVPVTAERLREAGIKLREVTTRELSDLFCWNCSRPVQRRTKNCPHCNVDLK